MSGKANEITKRLNEICLKIAKEKECSEHVVDLKRQIAKGRYYEQQSFKELIEIVGNSNLSISKASEILKLLRAIVDERTGNKDFLIINIYNFIAEKKVKLRKIKFQFVFSNFSPFQYRLDHLDQLISLCTFHEAPECKNPENIVYIAEQLLSVVDTEKQRIDLYQNYETILRQHGRDETLNAIIVSSISRVVAKSIKQKKWIDTVGFLTATLLTNQSFVVTSDEVFKDILKIITWLVQHGHTQANVMSFCLILADKLAIILTSKEHQDCCDILGKAVKMCCDGAITEVGLKKLQSIHYKTAKNTGDNSWLQEVTALVVQLFRDKMKLFETTAECFTAYNQLLVKFFHVFKFIKNKEGVQSCCSDIKRHKIINAIDTVLSFACLLVKAEIYDSSVAKHVEYHVKYGSEICNGLKCKSKHSEMLKVSGSIYGLIYQFMSKPSLLESNIKHLDECLKIMLKLYNQVPQDVKAATIDLSQMLSIYGKPKDKSSALIHANGVASHLAYRRKFPDESKGTKVHKHSLMRLMMTLREVVNLLGFESATEFIKSDLFSDQNFSGDASYIPRDEFILIEITALFRYSVGQNEVAIEKLFIELYEGTKDVHLLAEASQAFTDSTLKVMKNNGHLEVFKKINKQLDGWKGFDFEVSLALALNNYSIFYVLHYLAPRSEEKETVSQMIGKLQLHEELEHLEYLNESLRHFTDVICHLMKHKEDSDKILSMTRVLSILRNMATQYFMRGIKYKDFEAFSLLWHLAVLQGESIRDILNVATFFLDHHRSLTDSTGNYLRLSKKLKPLTVDEILERANETLEKDCIPSFGEHSPATQSHILSYLLSLWVYLITRKKLTGFNRWNKFKSLWETWKVPQEAPNRVTIHAKIYFCLVEINLKCCNRSADSFLSLGCTKLLSVTTFDHEFACQFHQIFYRFNMEAINHSMNRMVDMDHYEHAILSLICAVAKSRFCLKTLELLSLSILRYLNMEKLERAKVRTETFPL